MQFELTITLDNAAFEDDPTELPRLLRLVADRVTDGAPGGFLRDINGNTVGEFIVTQ